MTICDKFKPTILEGQLCYSIDIAKLGQKPTNSGKSNGLFLLLDPKPYDFKSIENSASGSVTGQSFKVSIHTLAQYVVYGPGSYGMNVLKKMTGTKSFEQLPDRQKKCLVHNREECQTRKYLNQVKMKCQCIPWALHTDQGKNQVKENFCFFSSPFCRISLSAVQKKRPVL